jgi:DNA-binding MarR family transcriptional regulator
MIMATPSAAEPDLGILLTAAISVFKVRLHAHLADAGYDDIGPSFGFVFRSLADAPLSLADLAARLGISSQGALKIVADMTERGYVERRNDPEDRRVLKVALTARGRSALREARRFHATTERRLVTEMSAKQVATARAVLEALVRQGSPDEASWAAAARPF